MIVNSVSEIRHQRAEEPSCTIFKVLNKNSTSNFCIFFFCLISPLQQAMDLGVPVLARDIPGNAAIVQHEFNGLLYLSPQVYDDKRWPGDHMC